MAIRSFLKKVFKACLPYSFIYLYRIYSFKFIFGAFKKCMPLKQNTGEAVKFIVTLTSYGKRTKSKAPYAICSLFSQTVLPDKIILWLAYGTKINSKLVKLQKLGLEIRYCEDTRSYKKLIPAIELFPDDVLITADDNAWYPADWFQRMKEAYLKDTGKVHCYRAHEIAFDDKKQIIPYSQWRKCIKSTENPKKIFPAGIGGILYPPKTFNSEVMNKAKYLSLAPAGEDIWFWAMVNYNKKEYKLVQNSDKKIIEFGLNDDGLYKSNAGSNKNDIQIKNVITEYPFLLNSLLQT